MSKQKYSLICVAHPDDESLFFSGLLLRRKTRQKDHRWTVICMTDGNADGQGRKRRRQFSKACSLLGVDDAQWWGLPDIYETRLEIDEIVSRLQSLPKPHEVFTHGILGEYGHPHHQDVSFAVHKAFDGHPRVYSVAYNSYPERLVHLTEKEYALKTKILTEIYGSETSRFLHLLPATFTEGFLRLGLDEVSALYDFFVSGQPLRKSSLKTYHWLIEHLKHNRNLKRPF